MFFIHLLTLYKGMMSTRVFLLVNFIVLVLGDGSQDKFRSIYETPQVIEEEGYVSETHGVLTSDGYMLEMHRIPFRRNETTGAKDRPVVFLMHGLLAASNSYILLGPKYSIAYNLADAGFDVWMGNARGTKNSRQHINKDPDGEDRMEFFNFTWEQIGYYDVANMIDYILMYTNNKKLHYIGHSQGGTAFLVLNSMRPKYNDKIQSAHLLAGVGYMEHFPNTLLRGLAMMTNTIYNLALRMEIVELFPPRNSSIFSRKVNGEYENFDYNCDLDESCRPVDLCTGNIDQKEMCELFGLEEIMSQKILDNLQIEFESGGAALKQVAHYGQNIQDKMFRRWDHGPLRNFREYGSPQPPKYNISLITVNLTMHYTVSDNLLDERDVLAMCEVIPNCEVRKVARESFGHVDFVAAPDVKDLVTNYIIERMWSDHVPAPSPTPNNDNCTVPDAATTAAPSSMIIIYLCVIGLLQIFAASF